MLVVLDIHEESMVGGEQTKAITRRSDHHYALVFFSIFSFSTSIAPPHTLITLKMPGRAQARPGA